MPRDLNTFALKLAKDSFVRHLRRIDRAAGYNTTPTVQVGAVEMLKLPAGEIPKLAIEFGDLVPGQAQFGGASQGLIRLGWATWVWGYVKSSGNTDDLYDSGLALLADLYAAIYESEPLPDAAGAETVIAVEPGQIVLDMEQFSADNRGYFLANFTLYLDLLRGGQP